MMKLYFSPGSCGLSPQIALREAGQEFELVKVDFDTKTSSEGNYFDVAPKGMIPALRLDNGEVITEGAVILQWIADQFPESNLLPPVGTKARYKALEWINFVATDMHKGMAVMFSPLIDAESKKQFAQGNLAPRFAYIEAHLANNDYLLGDQFCAADGYLFNVLSWPSRVGIDMSQYPAIRGFLARMRERPSVRAARKAEGLPSA
ncbi:glutathione transferase GstA [Cupriavidus campinensis]|jgi:glutathione S-transferase|uniref:glutathione transferase GstA n=1 Tax=Cupriavidus campinensis TaxID=151783 RepID=UPI0021CC9613|nr:glutathione transferase GstA [Cupriavidus campinensis]